MSPRLDDAVSIRPRIATNRTPPVRDNRVKYVEPVSQINLPGATVFGSYLEGSYLYGSQPDVVPKIVNAAIMNPRTNRFFTYHHTFREEGSVSFGAFGPADLPQRLPQRSRTACRSVPRRAANPIWCRCECEPQPRISFNFDITSIGHAEVDCLKAESRMSSRDL